MSQLFIGVCLGAIVGALSVYAANSDRRDDMCAKSAIQLINGKMYRCYEVETRAKP